MTSERKRTFTRRSRAGCRTCRLRHIKCDETPIACKNCVSDGWKCDGYDEIRLSHPGRGKRSSNSNNVNKSAIATIRTEPSLSIRRIETALPGTNSEERRGFAYFQCWTVPKMSGFFDTQLWHSLVLPMSYSERAVTHAVVALSALHEDIEARGVPLSRAELTNRQQRFALEQYTRALSALNARRHSNDPKLQEVILTCCLLFVVFELLRGQYNDAFVHLHQGLSLVKEYIESCLSETMLRLHLQSAFFGVDVSDPYQLTKSEYDDNQDFDNIMDARQHLDRLFQQICCYIAAVEQLPSEGGGESSSMTRLEVKKMQQSLRIELTSYLHRLNKFESRARGLSDTRCQRAIDLVRLHHRTFSLMLETYIDSEDIIYDLHVNEFGEAVLLAEGIANSFWEENIPSNYSRPTLLLDMGILPPLIYICLKCPSVVIRRQALQIIREWPHREGPWDSNLIAIMANLVLQLEIEMEFQRLCGNTATTISSASDITYISSLSRIMNVNISLDADQRSAILKYRTKECGPNEPPFERHILLDEFDWS
ncbi:conserved hypothetical protein [Talaromyces stipitatus ATCC 10500]|uniref:Zn(2)-C6 fungal-type domain-containing protein n=1 Tax=Talaromyces stipitatus (strain ATCC 10500 / CBS 375.48 / QM 6759 / NRRL 1006) TaxID=441959 RepID=B8MMP4_TALSN|nr:uncharacterized protein TSTA_098680 [Talaromyces stipitatus ATCC 10500]EED13611.1 conserved hypothetical protein [Talaromyces stipitatus ATCC 10500]